MGKVQGHWMPTRGLEKRQGTSQGHLGLWRMRALATLPSSPRGTAVLLSARHTGPSTAYLEYVMSLSVDGGGVHLPAQVDELLGQALHLVVKPLVDGAVGLYPRQLPKQLQHVLAQGAVHPDVRRHGDCLVVQPRHDEVLLLMPPSAATRSS